MSKAKAGEPLLHVECGCAACKQKKASALAAPQPDDAKRATDLARSALYGVMGYLGISVMTDEAVNSVASRLDAALESYALSREQPAWAQAIETMIQYLHERLKDMPDLQEEICSAIQRRSRGV
jgi:hypothetical protein